ncbi:MAG: hypothetical protein IAF38_02785 [Bacteroidia bacterium]|nr:hypothetical protein [Bacteroidia bacterium]
MNNFIITAYSIYLPVMIALTIWVARTIHKNTKVFLVEIFPNHETVAFAVNNLLQMGFYLISLGYGFLRLRIHYSPSYFSQYDENASKLFMTTQKELVEELASKVGGFTLFVGFLLFFNLFLMLILRRSSKNSKLKAQQFQQYAQNIIKPNPTA